MHMARLNAPWTLGSGATDQPGKQGQRLDELLEKLQHRQQRLERKLAAETRDAKRRHLELAIAVVRLQREKGLARRATLLAAGQ